MTASLVSICIPTYNGEKYLRECLDSAIAQSYLNVEIIIVDDQSSDNTVSLINQYSGKDKRIKFFSNKENLGLVGNWNRCMELAGGEWIKFLFQDDVLERNCVERMLSFSNDVKFVVANRKFIFENDVTEELRKLYSKKIMSLQKNLLVNDAEFMDAKAIAQVVSKFVYGNFIGEPTSVMFKKSIAREMGFFNPKLVQLCDLEYWLRIATNYGLYYIPETLASFRVHNQSMSSVNRASDKDALDKIVLIHEFLNDKGFENLRGSLTKHQLARLKDMFKLRIYEAKKIQSGKPKDLIFENHFRNIKREFALIDEFEKISLKTKLMYYIMMFKRKIINC